jgi:hypothetical protein
MKDKDLARRLDRLEERLGVKSAPYPNIITTTVNFDFPDEPPPEMIVGPGVYFLTFGRVLTPEELEEFRADYWKSHGIE